MDVGVEQTHRPSAQRAIRHWARPTAVACALLIAFLACAISAAANIGRVAETLEWQRLVTLWHGLLDHSSDAIYSPPLFRGLVEDLDRADEDLKGLADRSLLPVQAAADLRWVLHGRYQYIKDYHYAKHSRVSLSAAEASRAAAWWIIELQLSLLRDGPANSDLVEAARSNIVYQLTFLHHLEEFEAEVARRRKMLTDDEKGGESVDWDAFDADCQKRRNLLLDAYRQRKLPSVRSKEALLPYMLALTSARPASSPGTAVSTGPRP